MTLSLLCDQQAQQISGGKHHKHDHNPPPRPAHQSGLFGLAKTIFSFADIGSLTINLDSRTQTVWGGVNLVASGGNIIAVDGGVLGVGF